MLHLGSNKVNYIKTTIEVFDKQLNQKKNKRSKSDKDTQKLE